MLPHERAEKLAKWFQDWGLEPVVVAPLLIFITFLALLSYDVQAINAFFTAVVALSPIWIPLFMLRYVWIVWMHLVRYRYWFSLDHMLLEITLPPEVEKSPLAMEVVMTALHTTSGESTFIARLIKGNFRAIWSLEIASNEGRVSYYIHLRRAWRNVIEARIYGQFPEAKIVEAEDYASKVPFNLEEYQLWGCEYKKTTVGAVPIRTYYDYELNKDPDTPEKIVDPLSHILEVLSNVGKDEYMWLQFVAKAHKRDEWYGFYDTKHDKFKDEGNKAIKEVLEGAAKRLANGDEEKMAQLSSRGASILTEGEKRKIEAIEKSMAKLFFEVGIRGIYLAKKERFNPINISGGVATMFAPFSAPNLNSIIPTRALTVFDYPWQDFHDIRKNRIKQQLFFHYRNRAYFYVPYDQDPMFLTTEELASIWHFPSSAIQPPGLERVAAKRAEAPAGLPTEQ